MATTEPRRTLVDTNVLIDIATADPEWGAWSRDALSDAVRAGIVGVNPVIYAELAPAYSSVQLLDRSLLGLGDGILQRWPLPWSAAFLAGHAFVRYRRQERGTRRSPLPDFFIGAHASTDGLTLLTRDATRYGTYFPDVALIAP